MKGSVVVIVFISGAFASLLFGGFLTDYFKACLKSGVRSRSSGSHLPAESYLHLLEQSDLIDISNTQLNIVNEKRKAVETKDKSNLADALNTLKAAKEMSNLNKNDKAMRLYEHALALAPTNPIVLITFGEFLEASDNSDLVEADHMFALAIAYSDQQQDPDSLTRAVANRKRTALKVEEIDSRTLRHIEKKKLLFLDISDKSAALKRAKKEAYFQYVFHTVGIEGNTMSLAQTRSILETKLAVAGKSVMEHNEILGMDAALKFINQTLVDKLGDITMEDILEIHKRVIGHVDPLEAGIFRTTQVYVGDHIPPPPSSITLLVDRFTEWLNSIEALTLHPVRLAALAHYKLVYIHPFVDGNGRTSRLLMNLVLMQAGYPPVIIRRSDREMYYKYLSTANQGDIRPFVRFIAHCTEKTLDAYLWAAREFSSSDQELESDLPPNLIEHGDQQMIHGIRRRNDVPQGTFLDFSDKYSSNKIILEEQPHDHEFESIILPGNS